MTQETVKIRQGEKTPLTGEATLTGGTLTITGSVTATLYRRGLAVEDFADMEVTDVVAGPAAKVTAVYDLDTAGLTAGFYTLVFTFSADGSDGETRVFKPARNIRVLAPGAPD